MAARADARIRERTEVRTELVSTSCQSRWPEMSAAARRESLQEKGSCPLGEAPAATAADGSPQFLLVKKKQTYQHSHDRGCHGQDVVAVRRCLEHLGGVVGEA